MVTAVVVRTKAFVSGFLSITLEHTTNSFIPKETVGTDINAEYVLGPNYLPRSGENSHIFDNMNFIGRWNWSHKNEWHEYSKERCNQATSVSGLAACPPDVSPCGPGVQRFPVQAHDRTTSAWGSPLIWGNKITDWVQVQKYSIWINPNKLQDTGNKQCSSHLLTAAAKIPMLVSLGGIEEWPGAVDTLSFTVAWPFSLMPILQNTYTLYL